MSGHEHIANAGSLLREGPDAHLRYAALELRLAIEEIAYDKLRLYSPRLPASVLNKWQPPQAFKALEEFEPGSTHSFRLRIAPEVEYGVPGTDWQEMGEHRAFKLPWLRKTYNKLGGLVHLKAPTYEANSELSSIRDAGRLRIELQSILAEVERVAASQIDGSMATVIEFTCIVCEALIVRNEKGARANQRADCLQVACGAQHHVEFSDDGTATMHLIATSFDCMKCKAPIVVENRKLDIGLEFTCEACGSTHVIATKQWGYGIPGVGAPSA